MFCFDVVCVLLFVVCMLCCLLCCLVCVACVFSGVDLTPAPSTPVSRRGTNAGSFATLDVLELLYKLITGKLRRVAEAGPGYFFSLLPDFCYFTYACI